MARAARRWPAAVSRSASVSPERSSSGRRVSETVSTAIDSGTKLRAGVSGIGPSPGCSPGIWAAGADCPIRRRRGGSRARSMVSARRHDRSHRNARCSHGCVPRPPHQPRPRRRLRLQARSRGPPDAAGRPAGRRRRSSACSSATRPPTTPRSGRSTTAPASSPPPTSSRRWSTTRAISAGSPPPTRSPTSTPWAAGRSWRSPSSACRSARSRPRSSREILKGGAATCAEAGIPIAGGHSIDTPEPIYGLAVIGICRREDVRRNADARVRRGGSRCCRWRRPSSMARICLSRPTS